MGTYVRIRSGGFRASSQDSPISRSLRRGRPDHRPARRYGPRRLGGRHHDRPRGHRHFLQRRRGRGRRPGVRRRRRPDHRSRHRGTAHRRRRHRPVRRPRAGPERGRHPPVRGADRLGRSGRDRHREPRRHPADRPVGPPVPVHPGAAGRAAVGGARVRRRQRPGRRRRPGPERGRTGAGRGRGRARACSRARGRRRHARGRPDRKFPPRHAGLRRRCRHPGAARHDPRRGVAHGIPARPRPDRGRHRPVRRGRHPRPLQQVRHRDPRGDRHLRRRLGRVSVGRGAEPGRRPRRRGTPVGEHRPHALRRRDRRGDVHSRPAGRRTSRGRRRLRRPGRLRAAEELRGPAAAVAGDGRRAAGDQPDGDGPGARLRRHAGHRRGAAHPYRPQAPRRQAAHGDPAPGRRDGRADRRRDDAARRHVQLRGQATGRR